jgi:hypothetical protein
MNLIMKCVRFLALLLPAFALVAPAFAEDSAFTMGSFIVYPGFQTGVVLIDGVMTPKTEIELGAVCPTGEVCPEHQPIKVRMHWVCPGSDDITFKYICNSTDFDVFLTVNGKAVFNPELIQLAGDLKQASVRKPGFNADGTPCTKGYLIGYVVDTSDRPIKFDGLVGDAVLRVSPTAVEAYHAITFTADPALATGALITLGPDGGLIFDGGPGHYEATAGQVAGDVRYDDPGPPTTVNTSLILFTLDVRQGLSNYPTNVHFNFWSEDEVIESSALHFICYGEFNLSTKIDPNLTRAIMGTRKGIFQSGQAVKTPIGGIVDTPGNVTLFALVQTVEGPTSGNTMARSYIFNAFHRGGLVATEFLP